VIPPAPAGPTPEEHAKAVEQKTTELATAEKTRDETQAAFFAARKKAADLKDRVESARKAGQKRDTLIASRDALSQQQTILTNALEEKKSLATTAVFPDPPTDADVSFNGQPDLRPRYALIAVGVVAAICSCLLLMMSFGAGRAPADESNASYAAESYETDDDNGHFITEEPADSHHGTETVDV
jgi:hypothetical protein